MQYYVSGSLVNQLIVKRLQENVPDLEEHVTNYITNDNLTLDFQ